MVKSFVKRMGKAVTVTAAVVFTGTVLTAAPATAAPGGCTVTLSGKTATATCPSGTGEFRAGIDCGRYRPVFMEWQQFGPWVAVGKVSKVTCSSNAQFASHAFVETR